MKRVALFSLLINSSLYSLGQSDCDLKLDKDEIKVYTCELPDSKFKAIHSTFTLDATLSEVTAMIMDVDHHPEWQYKTLSAHILKKVDEHEIIYYTESEAPVLTSNRDFIIQLTVNQNPNTKDVHIEMTSIPDYIPAKEGIVRVPFSKAIWEIKKNGPRSLSVDYYIEIDIGGSVPAWMVNSVAHQAPYQTFKAMRERIGEYKGRSVSFIKN